MGSVMPDTPITQTEILKYMGTIPTGTVLYEIIAQDTPLSGETVIGTVTTTTSCVPSKFGDTKFYIRHQRMEEDFELRPEWLTQIDAAKECGYSDISPNPPKKCTQSSVKREII